MAADPYSGLKSFGAGHPSVHIRPMANGYHVAMHDGGDNVVEKHAPSLQNASDVATTHFNDMAAKSKAMGGMPPGQPGFIPPPPVTPAPAPQAAAPAAAPTPAAPATLSPQSSSSLMGVGAGPGSLLKR